MQNVLLITSLKAYNRHVKSITAKNFNKLLKFISPAGQRMLIFAKQKPGTARQNYVVHHRGQIVDSLQTTGIIHSAFISGNYLAS